MKGLLLFLMLAVHGALLAQGQPLRLNVGGDITIDKAGNVYDYRIATPVSDSVRQLIDRAVRKWQFEPVLRDGAAVHAKCGMNLHLVAVPVENGLRLRIDAVDFESGRRSKRMMPPPYPSEAQRRGVGGDVLLALRVDEKGEVRDVFVTQSSLRRGEKKITDGRWTGTFEKAALTAAKAWKFEPADLAAGESADATIVVPISFTLGEYSLTDAGWRPDDATAERKPIPWLSAAEQEYDATGLKAGQTLALGGASIKLKTAVVGATL